MDSDNKIGLNKYQLESRTWFALYVREFRQQDVIGRLSAKLDNCKYTAFCPTKDHITLRNGTEWKRRIPVFSNYIFVAADVSEREGFEILKPIVSNDEDVFRLLTYGDQPDCIALSEEDKALLLTLMDKEMNIPAIEATIEEGGRVIVTETVISGFEGRVKQIDKHKRTAEIEFNIGEKVIVETFALEIVRVIA